MKNNRFKKKSLDNEVKAIVSSAPINDLNHEETPKLVENKVIKEALIPTVKEDDLKIIIPKEKKIQMAKLGTSIKVRLKKDLDKKAKEFNRTTNGLVNIILENLYDEETKKFNIDLSKKEPLKITSYHIKSEHYKAIEKLCKQTGYSKSEVFNILIEKGLNNIK